MADIDPQDPSTQEERLAAEELGGEEQPTADWVPEDAITSTLMERSVNASESPDDLARRLVKENIPIITQQMIYLAIHSSSDVTRLRAGQYLMDRVLGKPGDDLKGKGDDDPIRKLLEDMADETAKAAEAHANRKAG